LDPADLAGLFAAAGGRFVTPPDEVAAWRPERIRSSLLGGD